VTHAETAGSHNPRLTGRGTRSSPASARCGNPHGSQIGTAGGHRFLTTAFPGRDIRLWPVDSEGPKPDPRIVDIPDTEGEPMIERSDCEA